jgi:hypothetical protein
MNALIDNSTITAAFRALGFIHNKERELFDVDVAALRLLIDHIILSENIVIVDNYKAEYSQERKEWLKYPFFKFEALPIKIDERFQKNASAHVFNMGLTRKLATSYVGVFDELSILFRHAWRNSSAFLVLKTLGVKDKYNSELIEGFLKNFTPDELGLKTTRKLKSKSYNRETQRVVESLSWAAVRTVYYRQAAKILGAEYFPHPIRNSLNLQCILFDNHPQTRTHKLHSKALERPSNALLNIEELISDYLLKGDYAQQIGNFFKHFWTTCATKEENTFGVSTYDVDIPPFLGFVLKGEPYSFSPRNLLERAIELRERAECIALRKKIHSVYSIENETDRDSAIRDLIKDFSELKQRLQVYLGYDYEKVGLKAKIVSYNFTVPRCLTKPFYPFKPHIAFIRDVILELTNVGSLGRLYDNLWQLSGGRGYGNED